MKKLITLSVCLLVGCATSTLQTNAYKTLASIDQAAKAAYGGYIVAAEKGYVATNDIPKITTYYNQVESACAFAAVTSEAGTNALSTVNLQTELQTLLTAIASVQTTTK